jgi:hypothetical protein
LQLGSLLSSLDDETNAGAALDAIGDIVLYAEVLEVGARYDETPGQYVSAAVRRYTAKATDEDWLGLMTAVEKGDNPGRIVLQRVLRWTLAQDATEGMASPHGGCSCGGRSGAGHDHH